MLVRKYLPLLVAVDISLALLVGYLWPQVSMLKAAIPFFLFVMLYPMMINLSIGEIGKGLKAPKLVILAVLMNFALTPLLGALWTRVLFDGADPYLKTGFLLKVLVPGSGMVAAWTGYARGKVESALIIIALGMVLSTFLVPLWMMALAGTYVHIDPLMIFRSMLLIIALPLVAGLVTRRVIVRKYGVERYRRIAPHFPTISSMGMLVMVFAIMSSEATLIVTQYRQMLLVIGGIATLYPMLFCLSILVSRMMRLGHGDAMALGYSVTAKNHAITIGVATTAFGGTLAVLPAAVAPIVQIPVMLLFLGLSDRIKGFLGERVVPEKAPAKAEVH